MNLSSINLEGAGPEKALTPEIWEGMIQMALAEGNDSSSALFDRLGELLETAGISYSSLFVFSENSSNGGYKAWSSSDWQNMKVEHEGWYYRAVVVY